MLGLVADQQRLLLLQLVVRLVGMPQKIVALLAGQDLEQAWALAPVLVLAQLAEKELGLMEALQGAQVETLAVPAVWLLNPARQLHIDQVEFDYLLRKPLDPVDWQAGRSGR